MPKVGNKKFSYSPKGMKAANKYARKTGQNVSSGRTRQTGSGPIKQRPPVGPGVMENVGKWKWQQPDPEPQVYESINTQTNKGPRSLPNTNKGGARRMPGSGGSRDVGANPNRLSNKRPTSIFNKNKGMKLMERRARVKKKLGY